MHLPRMKAPPFTRENAAEMARRATASRLARIAAERRERDNLATAIEGMDAEMARKARVLKQIARIDDLLDSCARDEVPGLVGAKEKLWSLVIPKAGSLRPQSQPRRRQSASLPEPSAGA